MKGVGIRTWLSLVLLGGVVTLVSYATPAAAVNCGDVIYTDTKLTANLNCSGSGIFINASDVTLDLNGFVIAGPCTDYWCPTGVRTAVSANHVTIKGPGVIRNFNMGIFIPQGSSHTVTGVTVSRTSAGLYLGISPTGVTGTRIVDNTVHDSLNGMVVFSGVDPAKNVIRGNAVFANALSILLAGSHNRVTGNVISSTATGTGIRLTWGYPGYYTQNNTIKDNRISGPGSVGVHVVGPAVTDNIIKDNVISGYSRGVDAATTDNLQIRGNIIEDSLFGVDVGSGTTNTWIENNTFAANTASPILDGGTGTVSLDNIFWP